MIETLANWCSSDSSEEELSNEYHHDRVLWLSNILEVLCLV